MGSKNTIFAIGLSVVLAVITFFYVSLFGLAGERGLGAPAENGYFLQASATPVMESLTNVYRIVTFIISGIVAFVMGLMIYIMLRFREKANPVPSKTSHNTLLEIVWTIVPVLLLLVIAVPSMNLLYLQDEIPETEVTVKAIGNTWNWGYQYPDANENIDFISAPLDETAALAANASYLLATDNAMVVPVQTKVKVLVTSSVNMHSWTVPSFGIKMDAVPGIINETWFEVYEEGTYYGQCSEICGVKHYKMPIEVKVVSKEAYADWIANDGEFSAQYEYYNDKNFADAQRVASNK